MKSLPKTKLQHSSDWRGIWTFLGFFPKSFYLAACTLFRELIFLPFISSVKFSAISNSTIVVTIFKKYFRPIFLRKSIKFTNVVHFLTNFPPSLFTEPVSELFLVHYKIVSYHLHLQDIEFVFFKVQLSL